MLPCGRVAACAAFIHLFICFFPPSHLSEQHGGWAQLHDPYSLGFVASCYRLLLSLFPSVLLTHRGETSPASSQLPVTHRQKPPERYLLCATLRGSQGTEMNDSQLIVSGSKFLPTQLSPKNSTFGLRSSCFQYRCTCLRFLRKIMRLARKGVWSLLQSFIMLGFKEQLSDEAYSTDPILQLRGLKDVICPKPSQLITNRTWAKTASLLPLEMLPYRPRGMTISRVKRKKCRAS